MHDSSSRHFIDGSLRWNCGENWAKAGYMSREAMRRQSHSLPSVVCDVQSIFPWPDNILHNVNIMKEDLNTRDLKHCPRTDDCEAAMLHNRPLWAWGRLVSSQLSGSTSTGMSFSQCCDNMKCLQSPEIELKFGVSIIAVKTNREQSKQWTR